MIIFRELHVHFHILVDLSADKLLLKSRDKRAGTDGQRIIRALATLKCFSVYKSFKIQCDHIILCHAPVCHFHRSSVALTLPLDLCVYIFRGHFHRDLIYLEALVFSQLHFRLHRHFRCKDKGLALLHLYHVYFRLGHNIQLTLVISLAVSGGDHTVDSVLVKDLRSVHLFQHLARYLSLTEARERDLPALLQICRLDRLLHFLSGNLDRKLCHIML